MRYFVVDVFTDQLFAGNPAGVCLPDEWPEDQLMQQIAFENNLAETAFVVPRRALERDHTQDAAEYDLRWFTPQVEMDLCGHATLASAFVLMNLADEKARHIVFHTRSGLLNVRREGERLVMNFPRRAPAACPVPAGLAEALGVHILETHRARDLLVLVGQESDVRQARPDFIRLRTFKDYFATILTAPGTTADFVSRFFAPNAGIDEDPVTGSSHSTLIPFWSERLGRETLVARQLSQRGGTLFCRDCGSRVEIGGQAVLFLAGEICLERQTGP